MRAAFALLILSAACNGADDQYQISGYTMTSFFPFDGDRTWEFTSTDEARAHYLIASLDPEFQTLEDGTTVHEISYDLQCIDPNDEACEDAWVRSLVWSVNRIEGIAIREVHAPDGDVVFDEPVYIAADEMTVGDSVTSGGFTSTFESIDPCPVLLSDDWDTCAHLVLSGGTELAGTHLNGEYWAVSNFNVVSMMIDSDGGEQWQLSGQTYVPTR